MIYPKKLQPNKLKSFEWGFTLVEMMVTIAIIAILLIASIPAYGKFGQHQKLNQAAEEIASVIRQTQNLALAPADDKSQNQNSYAFHCSNGARGYSILCYHYNANNDPTTTSSMCSETENIFLQYKKFSLPGSEIYFQSGCSDGESPSAYDIIFQIPSGKIANTNLLEIVVKNNKLTSNNTKTVKVNQETGQVWIE